MLLTASLATDALAFPLGSVVADMATTAERGGLDALWLGHGDAPALDPLPLLGSLIARTQRIGLGAAWSLDYSEPFHVARVFATLDHLSGGRTAWLFGQADAPALFDHRTAVIDPAARAVEFVDVVTKLWDSWEDEAFLLDVATGRFADPARVHPIVHAGPFFTVRGPLNVPRSVQGHPVVAQALGDAAPNPAAEILLVAGDAATRHGLRRPGRIMLREWTPDLGKAPAALARAMVDRLAQQDCDGFNLRLPPDDLARFTDTVVPLLQQQGHRPAASIGTTLRGKLGLARPRSRYAA